MPCQINDFMTGTYGKIPLNQATFQLIMEYQPWGRQLAEYLPASLSTNTNFKSYLANETSDLFPYSDMLMMTLPSPRFSYY